jgi:hypothetical protein
MFYNFLFRKEEKDQEIKESIPHKEKKENGFELDAEKMISVSTFEISPSELIGRAKKVIENGIGICNPDDLADDFEFIFPVIGPLSKKHYLDNLKMFDLQTMLPDSQEGLYYNFHIDPYEHDRVWFVSRMITEHKGGGYFGAPSFKIVNCPPQMCSLKFNKDGKVILYTGGYVMDKNIGNTGGLGGLFGILYSIGRPLPFPEANPLKKSWQLQIFSFVK